MYVVNLHFIQLGHSALCIITHSVLKSKFHFNETDLWSVRTTNQAQITRSPIHVRKNSLWSIMNFIIGHLQVPDKGALTAVFLLHAEIIHSIYWIVVLWKERKTASGCLHSCWSVWWSGFGGRNLCRMTRHRFEARLKPVTLTDIKSFCHRFCLPNHFRTHFTNCAGNRHVFFWQTTVRLWWELNVWVHVWEFNVQVGYNTITKPMKYVPWCRGHSLRCKSMKKKESV